MFGKQEFIYHVYQLRTKMDRTGNTPRAKIKLFARVFFQAIRTKSPTITVIMPSSARARMSDHQMY
jgi:hypothetical protein